MKDLLAQLADRIDKTRGAVLTEEATKNAYIMPFLQILGYDVFNPLEIVPEFTADVGIKEGEKVDYRSRHSERRARDDLVEHRIVNHGVWPQEYE